MDTKINHKIEKSRDNDRQTLEVEYPIWPFESVKLTLENLHGQKIAGQEDPFWVRDGSASIVVSARELKRILSTLVAASD